MIAQCPSRFGETPSTLKEVGMRLMGNVQAMVQGMAEDEVLKNMFSLYAFEHFEIACYKSLIAIAEDCGETEVARVCRQILRQEETAGRKLEPLIASVTRAISGVKLPARLRPADRPLRRRLPRGSADGIAPIHKRPARCKYWMEASADEASALAAICSPIPQTQIGKWRSADWHMVHVDGLPE